MPIYAYKGLDRSGKEVKNTLNVESINAAKQKISVAPIICSNPKIKNGV